MICRQCCRSERRAISAEVRLIIKHHLSGQQHRIPVSDLWQHQTEPRIEIGSRRSDPKNPQIIDNDLHSGIAIAFLSRSPLRTKIRFIGLRDMYLCPHIHRRHYLAKLTAIPGQRFFMFPVTMRLEIKKHSPKGRLKRTPRHVQYDQRVELDTNQSTQNFFN